LIAEVLSWNQFPEVLHSTGSYSQLFLISWNNTDQVS
jgi:hypothetical protein